MKKLTNLLLAGRGKESRKSSRKMQKLWSKKVQFKWQGEIESNWLISVAVLGVHSPVMRSRHQEN